MKRIMAKAEQIVLEGDSLDLEETEFDFLELELGEVELDRARVHNIRRKSELVGYLIDKDSEVFYNHPARQRHEVFGGYKRATQKGASLNECQVYNFIFVLKAPGWMERGLLSCVDLHIKKGKNGLCYFPMIL